MDLKDFIGYVVAQIIGAFVGAGILYLILFSTTEGVTGLGTNGFGEASAMGLNLVGAFVVDIVLTFVFIYTILGVTSDDKHGSIAGLVIGFTLTFVHLLGIKLTGTSVNPARSLAPAALMGGVTLQQVWLFIVAPFIGAALSAITFKFLNKA